MKYSEMEFENENTFDEFTTTIDRLDLEKEKDLPALTCVDLFPDPPHMISAPDQHQQDDSLADEDDFVGFKLSETKTEEEVKPENFNVDSSSISKSFKIDSKLVRSKTYIVPQAETSINHLNQNLPSSQLKIASITTVSIGSSPPVSPASYFSSAESVASSASSSKKSKKRYCRECNIHFRKTRELHQHLKTHIRMPDIRVERLSDENDKVKEYLSSISPKRSPTHGSLKLKLKVLGSQNFEVVSSENDEKPVEEPEQGRIRVLKAADIRCKPELDENVPLDPYSRDMCPKLPNAIVPPESRYFECPTFDGLDNFSDEMLNTGEATEDLLKKLLENNKEPQSFQREPDWSANANEFISIDSLAARCNVCHTNFSHPKYLYEHKQITGHDFPNRMGPIPTSQPNYGHQPQNNFMQAPQNMPPLYQMAQMRGNFPAYGPRMNSRPILHQYHQQQPSPPPGFHPSQCMMTRTPPPLYRVNGNPANFPPQNRFLEKRNMDMYGPSHFIGQPQQMNDMMRQPIFLKSRLQKAIRGRSQGPTNEMPTSPVPGILTQQTAIRPRFLGPNHQMLGQMQFQRTSAQSPPKPGEPPLKKIKIEPGQNQFSAPSPNGISSPGIRNSPGIPVIHSVHSGVNANFPQMGNKPKASSPSVGDQGNLTPKGVVKNPKDVANMLANRGITVTHKGKTSFVSLANKGGNAANNSAQEAVQKLQANNSVSIISKKKPSEIHITKLPPPNSLEGGNRIATKFLSCPVITCKEKFLTNEGVNRHAFRWHGIPMPNPDRLQKRIIRCRLCHHICSSHEILQEHIRREHEPSINEIGIPIVDLRNDEVKRKLAGLGIFNYVPLTAAGASTSSLAFPVVSVQGAANPSICNLLGLGASSVLSLGPVKSITIRKQSSTNENK